MSDRSHEAGDDPVAAALGLSLFCVGTVVLLFGLMMVVDFHWAIQQLHYFVRYGGP